MECADAAHGLGGHIITDLLHSGGGYRKTLGLVLDFVMLGGMLAGHDGVWEKKVGNHNGSKMKFYGMSSEDAQITYYGEKQSHASEGKTVYIDYRGPVKNTIEEIMGGLRSHCTMQVQKLSKTYQSVQLL